MPKRDITFEIIRLLSQRIVSDPEKYPEGALIQKTSCMNPADAELIGTLEAIKVFLDSEKNKKAIQFIDKIETFLERIGLSRWEKGELTQLGFRAGLKYQEEYNLEGEAITIDEADASSSDKE